MKLQYWGTAAAEGIPGAFCGCDVCMEARAKGGRYVRTRSQVLLDDCLLVDFGADTYMHSLKYGFDMSKLEHIVITHVHHDHYYPTELGLRREGYAHNMRFKTLTVHGSQDIENTAYKIWDARGGTGRRLLDEERLKFDIMKPYESRSICGFNVTALPASHGTDNPFIYIFEKDGKTMLLHNDCGYLKPEVMEWIKNKGIKFDLVSYECTYATRDASENGKISIINHLGLPNDIEERRRFVEIGAYKDNTVDIITHFSHNTSTVGYGDMLGYAEKEGFLLAYDGMTVEF